MDKISVVIPTFNRAHLVAAAIESALAQNIDDLEIIIVDDGSTDNTSEAIRSFNDAVVYIKQPGHAGVAHARNTGIKASSGTYIAFLDSDDRWFPGKLKIQLDHMESNAQAGLSFTDYEVWMDYGSGRKKGGVRSLNEARPTLARLFRKNFIGTLTVMVRRQCLFEAGLFDENLRRGSDYDMWLRIARRWSLLRVPRILASYRCHEASLTGLDPARDLETHHHITHRLLANDPTIRSEIVWHEPVSQNHSQSCPGRVVS